MTLITRIVPHLPHDPITPNYFGYIVIAVGKEYLPIALSWRGKHNNFYGSFVDFTGRSEV